MDIFKLIKLKVKDHNVFNENIEFDFFKLSDFSETRMPYFTMVLGPNGTGKSNLLRLIIEIFKVAFEKSIKSEIKQYPTGKYSLEYIFNDASYTILNSLGLFEGNPKPDEIKDPTNEKGIRIFKNGVEIPFDFYVLPKSILAVSIMLNESGY